MGAGSEEAVKVSAGSGADGVFRGIDRFPAAADVLYNPIVLLLLKVECHDIGQFDRERNTPVTGPQPRVLHVSLHNVQRQGVWRSGS
jgi:hypothetical protein